jgi:hypothetical protein
MTVQYVHLTLESTTVNVYTTCCNFNKELQSVRLFMILSVSPNSNDQWLLL